MYRAEKYIEDVSGTLQGVSAVKSQTLFRHHRLRNREDNS